jgi:succinyl-CoA synthetase beta subunit
LVAADAKLNFDDNAAFRQKEIFALRDPTQEDPREVCYVYFFPYMGNFTGYVENDERVWGICYILSML